MKKTLLTIFAFLSVLTAFAQADWNPQAKTFDQYWMVGAKYGIAEFHGDVSNKNFFAKLGTESKPSWGISVSRQYSPMLAFKFDFSHSYYFSKNRLRWRDTVNYTDLSVTGDVTEFGVYGILNLNKFLGKNKETGDTWNAYLSTGIGLANWRCKLKSDDDNSILAYIGYSATGKSTRKSALSFPITIGGNLQIADGIWLYGEHSIHFVESDLMDGYINGYTDIYSSTTIGITVKLDKIKLFGPRSYVEKTSPVSKPKSKTEKPAPKSRVRGAPKNMPEIQEYTGYNDLLPPVQPKIDTTHKVNAVSNAAQNVWEAQADSGRNEITGAQKTIRANNDTFMGNEPQTGLEPLYRIQIQASKTYIPIDAFTKKHELHEKVFVELRSDGWYRYYIGQYSTLSDATAMLSEMRAKGIKDAFVVSFKANVRKVIKQ